MRTAFVRRSVSKFMPGERIEDAIEAAKKLQPQGLNTILTRLGENLTRIEEAQEVFDHYLKVVELIQAAGLDAQISIKPTQLGYDQNPEVCYGYCIRLLERCGRRGSSLASTWRRRRRRHLRALLPIAREIEASVGIAVPTYLFLHAEGHRRDRAAWRQFVS
jgi:proline dehydrogenase